MKTITVSEEDGLEIVRRQAARLVSGSTILKDAFTDKPDYAKIKTMLKTFNTIVEGITTNVEELSK